MILVEETTKKLSILQDGFRHYQTPTSGWRFWVNKVIIFSKDYLYILRTCWYNWGRRPARCVKCGTLDWWSKDTAPSTRVCIDCYYAPPEDWEGA